MADDLTADALEGRTFTPVRRGYDRAEVDGFVSEVVARIRELEASVAAVSTAMEQLGISELPDVQREIATVSAEVGEILEEARRAAEQMRTRAAGDAGRWRAEADAEVRSSRRSAQRDSEKARTDAWETATEMLEQAAQHSTEVMAEAEKDALFIRAEAEREALRMTGDARRDTEELVREARSEAERILMRARAEAENIQSDARQSAEAAQERARALEQRRAELMSELESARVSIGQLENEIDSRREALHQAATSSDTTVRVIDPEVSAGEAAGAWAEGGASVKIVPASRIRTDEPVDADALVAEVEELRARAADIEIAPDAGTAEPAAPVEGRTPAPPEPVPATPRSAEPQRPPAGEPRAGSLPESETAPVPEAAPEQAAEPGPEATPGAEATPEPETAPEPASDHVIDDLFASLRSAPDEAAQDAADEPEPAPEPMRDAQAEKPAAAAAVPATRAEPFDVRDRHLLPIANRGLRSVKREIVELQNRVLEELRTSGSEWKPDTAMFSAALSGDLNSLVQESYVAGHAAAAEIVGSADTPQPATSPPGRWPSEFVAGLGAAVSAALADSTGAGGGARQTSAAVSKVFRAWRTDEAERRLRFASRAAYHAGLEAGFAELGIARVMAVSLGRACGDCAAGTGVGWAPGDVPVDGSTVPPAHPACDDTIVPAEASS